MLTRSLVTVLALIVASMAAPSCKADRSKPIPGAAEAEPAEPKAEPSTEPAPQPKTAPAGEDKKGAKGPTNLKVLPTTLSVAQVTQYMRKLVTRGLGVKCAHCHERGDFASDRNEHKKAARSMMQMTSVLNRQYFGGKNVLSCFTCHKGKEKPAAAR